MGKNKPSNKSETILTYGAGFGAAFGAAVGAVANINMGLAIGIGVALGAAIALSFGKQIARLFGDPNKTDTSEEKK